MDLGLQEFWTIPDLLGVKRFYIRGGFSVYIGISTDT